MAAADVSIELFVSDEQFFRVSEVERFAGDAGFIRRISLRSGPFALWGHRFYFERLEDFLTQVRGLYNSLSGRAELSTAHRSERLTLTARPRGHVSVSGHFELFDGESQRLDFGFTTDQTFLPALIRSLETACHKVIPKSVQQKH